MSIEYIMAGGGMWIPKKGRLVPLNARAAHLSAAVAAARVGRRRMRRQKVSGTRVNFANLSAKNPFPARMNVRQNYAEIVTFTTGAVGVMGVEQLYAINDQFDPNFTGVGHQPYGRDTLATIYNKYKVTGFSWELKFSDPSADGVACAIMFTPPHQVTTLAGLTISDVLEKQNTLVKYVNDSGAQTIIMKGYYPMHKIAQITSLQFKANVEDYNALSGASPIKRPFLRLSAGSIRATAGTTVVCSVRLTFHTTWYDRIVLAQS